MYCHQCGKEIEADGRFCKHCGAEVNPATESDETEQQEPTQDADVTDNEEAKEEEKETALAETNEPHQEETLPESEPRKTHGAKFAWLVPVISLMLVGAGLTGYYFYETDRNEEVLALQEKAEAAALEGKYPEAEKALNDALNVRPEYQVLTENLAEVQLANDFSKDLEKVRPLIKEQKYAKAEKQLLALNERVREQAGPLFQAFPEQMEAAEMTLTVGMVKEELGDLTTVDALNDKLQIIETLSSDEGEEVKKQILTKIVKITMDDATVELDEKQFSDALAIVNDGLEYEPDSEKLLSLKDRIEQEQTAFEQAEQQRVEQAMEAAAKEDLKNRTEAVEVTNFETEIDAYGDLYLTGTVKNVATTGISSITINYRMYDTNGLFVNTDTAYVYPNYLAPGEQGTFDDVSYFVNDTVSVEIDQVTWYVE